MTRLTKATLAAAGLKPGDLATVAHVDATTASRYVTDKAYRIEAPGAVLALIYAWPHLPAAVRADLQAKKHLGQGGDQR